jgi:hypothetical protein
MHGLEDRREVDGLGLDIPFRPKLFAKSMILRATSEFWSSAAVGDAARFETPTCTVT